MEIPLPTIQFNVKTLQSIYEDCKLKETQASSKDTDEIVNKVIKELNIKNKKKGDLSNTEKELLYKPVIEYIQLHYYETEKGAYYLYDVKTREFLYRENNDFKKEVLIKLKDAFINDIIERNEKIFHITAQLKKPRLYIEDDIYYLNECKGFLHKNPKPYKEYSKDLQKKVKIMLDFILEVYCNNDKTLYDAYIKYIAQLCRGMKTEVIIYMKSHIQGVGKSTGTDYLIDHVLGRDICLISGTEPLLKDFNKIFLGKLLILFEELPTFSPAQWEAVSSKLKTMTTEKQTVYRGLFKEPIQAENISNFYINTNVESIKDSNGRRIIIMPINSSRLGDYDYFNCIRENCFNNEVGEVFYSYMLSLDISNFYGQRDFPELANKQIAIANLLHPVYKFIKEEYYLKKIGLNRIKPKDLHKNYENYCVANGNKALTRILFMSKLEEINIKFKKLHGDNVYQMSYEELNEIATKFKWVCDYDEFNEDTEDTTEEEDESEDDHSGSEYKWKLKYEELERKYNKLKKRLSLDD